MIIRDIYKNTLSLTTKKLIEKTGQDGNPTFFLYLNQLRDIKSVYRIWITNTELPSFKVLIRVQPKQFQIGCRKFSEKVYNQIMKAACAAKK